MIAATESLWEVWIRFGLLRLFAEFGRPRSNYWKSLGYFISSTQKENYRIIGKLILDSDRHKKHTVVTLRNT